ncbi:MAG: Zn-ribbon domain-containing OB-fold protein [Acidimicrobiales bacterium]
MVESGTDLLKAHHVVEYPYHRSVGPVLGRYFAGLRGGRIEGVMADGGRVVVPPTEYDPVSGAATGEAVEVSDCGTVTTWCWVSEPLPHHLIRRPFAFALVKLDGADTSMLHYVDAGLPEAMSTGMRVRAAWRAERVGHVTDIVAFVPEDAASGPAAQPAAGQDPVTQIVTPIRLEYDVTAGRAQAAFLRGLVEGRLIGRRCPKCQKVYLPPRGACPTDGVPTTDLVECGQRGVVTTFCVVNVPFRGQSIELPYVCAQVLVDGADIAFMALIQECEAAEVRMGMRVEAVWRQAAERSPSLEALAYFRPSGEPDAAYESFSAHL